MVRRAAAGEIWSARFEGVKPFPATVVPQVTIGRAGTEDLPAIQSVLAEAGLPTDVEPHLGDFLVARHQGQIVGCVSMEVQETDALFRSLAVDPAYRGSGRGRRLYDAPAERARYKGVERAYLLTTTIVALAESWRFKRIDRAEVPPAIRETCQFRGVRCASAVAIWRDIRMIGRVASFGG